jgi:hypothetical protein
MRRLGKVRFEEQDVEKMAVELKEVIEKATPKKKIIVKGAKGTGKKNEWWDKECEQLKKEAVKALREWKRGKINRNSFLVAKRRYRERDVERRRSRSGRGRRKR